MKTLNQTLKPALVAGIVALFACAVTVHADDSQNNQASGDNAHNSGDNSNNNGDDAKGENSGGGVVSPVQSSADPYGLKVAGKVMLSGSDAAAKSFNQSVLPSLDKFIRSSLPDGQNNMSKGVFEIDPNKIVLASKSAVRAYFVSESGGYASSIGMDATTPGNDPSSWEKEISSPAAKLIFPSANSVDDFIVNSPSQVRTANQPVLPGDFVNLGTFAKGAKLDFFMIANGANQNGAPVYSTTESINPDGFQQHVAGFTSKVFAVPQLNSPYIFLAFKDMWGGGDKDMNDVVVALDVGVATVKSLLATPEPATWLTLGSFLVLGLVAKRRMATKANCAN